MIIITIILSYLHVYLALHVYYFFKNCPSYTFIWHYTFIWNTRVVMACALRMRSDLATFASGDGINQWAMRVHLRWNFFVEGDPIQAYRFSYSSYL